MLAFFFFFPEKRMKVFISTKRKQKKTKQSTGSREMHMLIINQGRKVGMKKADEQKFKHIHHPRLGMQSTKNHVAKDNLPTWSFASS